MQTVNISLPKTLAQKLDNVIIDEGYASRSEFIRALIRNYLSSDEQLDLKPFKKRSLKIVKSRLTKTGQYNGTFVNSVMKGLSRSSIYAKS